MVRIPWYLYRTIIESCSGVRGYEPWTSWESMAWKSHFHYSAGQSVGWNLSSDINPIRSSFARFVESIASEQPGAAYFARVQVDSYEIRW